jgi:hypothetical protein
MDENSNIGCLETPNINFIKDSGIGSLEYPRIK